MTDPLVFHSVPDPAAVRRAERRKALEEAEAADERAQNARDHLAALKGELVPLRSRVERLRVNGDLRYVVADPTQLAPGPGLVIGGQLKDLLPAALADLDALEQQIAQAERELADL
jgi:hypothetical protein